MTQVDIFDNAGGYLMKSGVILMTCVGYLDEMCYRLANMGETASGRASQLPYKITIITTKKIRALPDFCMFIPPTFCGPTSRN